MVIDWLIDWEADAAEVWSARFLQERTKAFVSLDVWVCNKLQLKQLLKRHTQKKHSKTRFCVILCDLTLVIS